MTENEQLCINICMYICMYICVGCSWVDSKELCLNVVAFFALSPSHMRTPYEGILWYFGNNIPERGPGEPPFWADPIVRNS